jgi:hypothetical protein
VDVGVVGVEEVTVAQDKIDDWVLAVVKIYVPRVSRRRAASAR